jgi:zinc protease
VDAALPLLAQYVGSLPASAQAPPARFADVGITFPGAIRSETVEKGKEPRGQTVLSFFAEPTTAPIDQEYVIAATTVLDIVLRDVLREDLGQTYTVGVGLNQALPQRGGGHIDVRFGAAPDNLKPMVDRTLQEIQKLQQAPPSADLTNRAKESARRTFEESLRTNAYWLGRLRTVRLFGQDPALILTRNERIDSVTPQVLQDTFKKYFPLDRYTVVTLRPEAGVSAN